MLHVLIAFGSMILLQSAAAPFFQSNQAMATPSPSLKGTSGHVVGFVLFLGGGGVKLLGSKTGFPCMTPILKTSTILRPFNPGEGLRTWVVTVGRVLIFFFFLQ